MANLKKMKRISLFTGTRAEYGLMRTLILNLIEDSQFDFNLLVSAAHLNNKYGLTIKEIESDGIKIKHKLPISFDNPHELDMAYQTSETIKVISKTLLEIKPEYLIVLGDRYETFAAATAAHLLGIKIIHLHGGETTLGAIDDKLRNAITQLSSIHFTSAEVHRQKVQNMILSKNNTYNVGPLSIDGLLNLQTISKEQFEAKTGFNFSNKNFLITYHPETIKDDLGISGLENLLKVLSNFTCNILFTSPNADKGSDIILNRILNAVKENKNNYFYIPSLGQHLYLNALLLFDYIVGNSSSGIIEAPLLKKKVINIGSRQNGRYRFGRVIDVDHDYESISSAIYNIVKSHQIEEYDIREFKKNHETKSPSYKIIKFLKSIL